LLVSEDFLVTGAGHPYMNHTVVLKAVQVDIYDYGASLKASPAATYGNSPYLAGSRLQLMPCHSKVAHLPPDGIFTRDPLVKLQRRHVVQVSGVQAQMFEQKLAAQRVRDGGIPNGGIQLAMAEQGIRMQVARSLPRHRRRS
jgi:hypothetical protein